MELSKKTIQSHINFFISGDYTWVDVDYRGDSWQLTCEQYPEDVTANFYFTNGNKSFAIETDPVFNNEQLCSATVKSIHYLAEEIA